MLTFAPPPPRHRFSNGTSFKLVFLSQKKENTQLKMIRFWPTIKGFELLLAQKFQCSFSYDLSKLETTKNYENCKSENGENPTFRSSNDSIIKKKMFLIMQITAMHLKRCDTKINITGCEDYENTFARIESDCTLRFGFKVQFL